MSTNLLISFPASPVRCFQLNRSYLDELYEEDHDLYTRHYCDYEDGCRGSLPCLKSDIFSHVIANLYNIDLGRFYLLINGHLHSNKNTHDRATKSDPVNEIQFKDSIAVTVLFKLLGGKGGFGKILKSQASKKRQSNNQDSCRNLQGQRIRTVRLAQQMDKWKEQQSSLEKIKKEMPKSKKKEELDESKSRTLNDQKYLETVTKEVSKVKETVLRGFDKKLSRESQELKLSLELESKRSDVLDACLDVYDL